MLATRAPMSHKRARPAGEQQAIGSLLAMLPRAEAPEESEDDEDWDLFLYLDRDDVEDDEAAHFDDNCRRFGHLVGTGKLATCVPGVDLGADESARSGAVPRKTLSWSSSLTSMTAASASEEAMRQHAGSRGSDYAPQQPTLREEAEAEVAAESHVDEQARTSSIQLDKQHEVISFSENSEDSDPSSDPSSDPAPQSMRASATLLNLLAKSAQVAESDLVGSLCVAGLVGGSLLMLTGSSVGGGSGQPGLRSVSLALALANLVGRGFYKHFEESAAEDGEGPALPSSAAEALGSPPDDNEEEVCADL